MKAWLTLPMALLTAASSPLPVPEINDSGRVLATLDDWRAIIFSLILLLFLQVVERWIAGFRAGRALDRAISALEKSAASDASAVAAMTSFAATLSRLEAQLMERLP